MIRAAKMDTVKVLYTGRLSDGTIFDQSSPERPLSFIVGKGEVITGFEEAVDGMYQGESKTVTIPFVEAYGASDPGLIEELERSKLPEDVELTVGGQLEVTHEDGTIFRLMVVALTEETVTLDGNHPLAGKDLTFDITLEEVKKKPVE